jgi:purine-cytosine permease-like protein
MGARVLTGSVLAVIGLITVKVLMAVFGAFMSFVSFMFFTVVPIVLVGWLIMKAIKYVTRDRKPAYE